jgi:CspA family cold shock protein
MPPRLNEVILNGSTRHSIKKGFILVKENTFDEASQYQRNLILSETKRIVSSIEELKQWNVASDPNHESVVIIETPFLYVHTPTYRDAFIRLLHNAIVILSNAAHSHSFMIVGCGVNPFPSRIGNSDDITICADYHRIETIDEDEAERIYNLYRQFLPELLAVSTNSSIFQGQSRKEFSVRMLNNKDSYLPRYISLFSKKHLDHLKFLILRDYAIADLSLMDVNPIADDSIELRFVDSQCSLAFTRSLMILFQAIAMYGRTLARNGRRLRFLSNRVISENKTLAIQAGPTAVFQPDPSWKDENTNEDKGFWFHDFGKAERAPSSLLSVIEARLLDHLLNLRTDWWEIAPILLGAELRRRGKRCLVNYAEYQKYLYSSKKQGFATAFQQILQQLINSPDTDLIYGFNLDSFEEASKDIEREWGRHLKLPERVTGTIVRYIDDRKFGFVQPESGGAQIFFRQSDIEGIVKLKANEPVSYIEVDENGRKIATRLRSIPKPERVHGWVMWFNEEKKFGSVKTDENTDVFVRLKDIIGLRTLVEGQEVTFVIEQDQRGKKRATKVRGVYFSGVVKWFNKERNYGFIAIDGSGDVFAHRNDILGQDHLNPDQKVRFMIGKSNNRGKKAIQIEIIEDSD